MTSFKCVTQFLFFSFHLNGLYGKNTVYYVDNDILIHLRAYEIELFNLQEFSMYTFHVSSLCYLHLIWIKTHVYTCEVVNKENPIIIMENIILIIIKLSDMRLWRISSHIYDVNRSENFKEFILLRRRRLMIKIWERWERKCERGKAAVHAMFICFDS